MLIAGLLILTACSIQNRDDVLGAPTGGTAGQSTAALSPLRPLDEGSSADFAKAFDDAKDRTRIIVALSPT